MILKAAIVWIAGLMTAVPYATYYLLYDAQRDQYAVLITFVLFWIFGYWGVVGPLIAAIRVHRVMRGIERAMSNGDVLKALHSDETREVAIDLMASEHHIPRFLAARVYGVLMRRLSSVTPSSTPSSEARGPES